MGNGPQLRRYEGDKALPEPRVVKRDMLDWRREVHAAARRFATDQHQKNYDDWRQALFELYLNVRPFLDDLDSPHRNYAELRKMDTWVSQEEMPRPDFQTLMTYTELLETLLKDLGVTDIGLRRDRYEWGYEFLNGLPFNMNTENEGWRRLKQNILAMDELLRQDTDFMIVVTGGNRVGKDTLALQMCNLADDSWPSREHMVVDDDDFWHAVNELPKYSWFEITELSDHFYSKSVMDGAQKKKKRKLKKYAAENMCAVGCDLNFWNIDREVINDKVTVNIHVPARGKFEFYPKELVDQFDKDADTGECIRPTPAFTGRFPKAPGSDRVDSLARQYDSKQAIGEHLLEMEQEQGQELELYEHYVVKEAEKFRVSKDEQEDDALTVPQLVSEIKADQDRYLKQWGDRTIVNKDLVKADFDGCDEDKARQAKAKAEADLGIGEKGDD